MTKTLLITGGAGFIGSAFVRMALARKYKAVVLDKLTYAGNLDNLEECKANPDFEFIQGDIGDGALIEKILKDKKIDAVLNFAAETHVDRSITDPLCFVQTNIVGTAVLLDNALRYYRALDERQQAEFRFLHVSTDEVFGELVNDTDYFRETTPYAPRSPYSASKAGSDHIVRAYGHTYGLPILVTNCSNNFGPRQFPEKLIPLCLNKALSGEKLPVYGDGKNVRNWIYVDDHCQGVMLALEKGKIGETYCFGSDCELPNIELVHALCDILDQKRPRPSGSYRDLITFVTDRLGHDRRYAVDSSKAIDQLGFKCHQSFEENLAITVDWYLSHAK